MDNWNNMSFNNPLNFQNQRQNNNFNMGYMAPAPRYEVIRVNGESGAKSFRMAPNSNALLLDETASIVWFVQTDGAGYLTATPYDIFPHQQAPQIDIDDLAKRVAQLEELINAKSNNFTNKSTKKQRNEQPVDAAN